MHRKDIEATIEILDYWQEIQPSSQIDKAIKVVGKLERIKFDKDTFETAIKVLATIGGHEEIIAQLRSEL